MVAGLACSGRAAHPKGSLRNLIIGVVIVIVLLAGWRWWAGRVDRSDPSAVASAFLAALKSENVGKASGFWVPDGAEAWKTATTEKLYAMPSGSHSRFFEDLPGKTAVFTVNRNPKSPVTEQTLSTPGFSVDLRQIGGKWYVCRAPL